MVLEWISVDPTLALSAFLITRSGFSPVRQSARLHDGAC